MNATAIGCAAAASFVVSLVVCGAARRFALDRAMVDRPNERSLHKEPVPRVGGVAVVVGAWLIVLVASLACGVPLRDGVGAWLTAALPIALLGLLDDVRPQHFAVRLGFQIAVSTGFVLYVGIPSQLAIADGVLLSLPAPAMGCALVVFLTGVLNIYNFMDGMDGLAGSQAITAGLALFAVLTLRAQGDLALVALAVAASSAGFVAHNYPPARIFLGDAGSTFLGFTFGALALLGAVRDGAVPFAASPIALAPFLLDGVFTILRRASRREPIWKAHRTHLYQRAVATGLEHRDVLLRYLAWMAIAAAGALIVTATSGTSAVAALAAVMLVPLLGTWAWVVRRERRSPA